MHNVFVRCKVLTKRGLVEVHAQLPGLCRLSGDGTHYVSDIQFDNHDGDLIVSCSTEGRVAVHELQQFACAAPEAEQKARVG